MTVALPPGMTYGHLLEAAAQAGLDPEAYLVTLQPVSVDMATQLTLSSGDRDRMVQAEAWQARGVDVRSIGDDLLRAAGLETGQVPLDLPPEAVSRKLDAGFEPQLFLNYALETDDPMHTRLAVYTHPATLGFHNE